MPYTAADALQDEKSAEALALQHIPFKTKGAEIGIGSSMTYHVSTYLFIIKKAMDQGKKVNLSTFKPNLQFLKDISLAIEANFPARQAWVSTMRFGKSALTGKVAPEDVKLVEQIVEHLLVNGKAIAEMIRKDNPANPSGNIKSWEIVGSEADLKLIKDAIPSISVPTTIITKAAAKVAKEAKPKKDTASSSATPKADTQAIIAATTALDTAIVPATV